MNAITDRNHAPYHQPDPHRCSHRSGRKKWLCRVKVELETNWINSADAARKWCPKWWRPSPVSRWWWCSAWRQSGNRFLLPAIYSNQFPPPLRILEDGSDGSTWIGAGLNMNPPPDALVCQGIKSMVIEADSSHLQNQRVLVEEGQNAH